jgi:SAM-dependent methyltransferase
LVPQLLLDCRMSLAPGRALRGVRTVLRRRGVAYLAYLAREHALPRLAYDVFGRPPSSRVLLPAACGVWAALDEFSGATASERLQAALRRASDEGAPLVDSDAGGACPSRQDLQEGEGRRLDRLLTTAHRIGLTGLRHSLDELRVTPGGRLVFRGLHGVRHGRANGIRFQLERDLDRHAVNRRFGLSLLTEAGVRQALRSQRAQLPEGWFRDYAPIDFGGGVSVGRFPSTDSGTGRWDFLNGPVVAPIVGGRRVLDLGSNNGSLPLMMLRAGATEVVAVEQSDVLADAMRLYRRVLEWRDLREYRLDVRVGDMRAFLDEEWGAFDVITAFCSIYYLPEEDVARIIRKAAATGATLVLQANEAVANIRAARTTALRDLVSENGYGQVTVHVRDAFARPLLVAAPTGARSLAAISVP